MEDLQRVVPKNTAESIYKYYHNRTDEVSEEERPCE